MSGAVMRKGAWVRAVAVVALVLAGSVARAEFKRTAIEFLRGTTSQARQTLCTAPGQRPALEALGEVLERGRVPSHLLSRVVSNPHAQPYLGQCLRALKQVDHLPGACDVLERMASGRDDASVRGPSYELAAGVALKGELHNLAGWVEGNEVDGVLNDGTVVEVKNFGWRGATRRLMKAEAQLTLRCASGRPALLVVNHDPTPGQLRCLDRFARRLGTGMRVITVDPETFAAREVLKVAPGAPRIPRVRRTPPPFDGKPRPPSPFDGKPRPVPQPWGAR